MYCDQKKIMASKSISKSVVWQLAGKFALQGITFFTTPIFTRLLSPSDYGYTSLYMSWSVILGLIVGLQTCGSLQNALLKYSKEEQERYCSSVMSISFLSFLVCLIIALVFNNSLSTLLSLRKDLIILLVCQSFANYIVAFYVDKCNSLKQVEKSTFLSVVQTVFSILLSLFFVFVFKNDKAVAKIYGNAIPVVIVGFVILIIIYVKGKCFWNWSYNKFCFTLTFPLIFHGIGHLVFSQSDRIMLQKMMDSKTLGIYSVSFSLCSVLSIIYSALNSAWLPFYYDLKMENQREEILYHSKRYIKFFTVLTLGFMLLASDVFNIMAPVSYKEGLRVIPLFVCSHFFNFLYLFPINFEFYHEKTKLISMVTFSAAVINIVINWILIPSYGIFGAAVGTLCAHILLFIFHEIIARVMGKYDYEYRNPLLFIIPIIIVILFCNLFLIVPDISAWIRWLIACVLGIITLLDIIKKGSIF